MRLVVSAHTFVVLESGQIRDYNDLKFFETSGL
jgi:hypothetical protein